MRNLSVSSARRSLGRSRILASLRSPRASWISARVIPAKAWRGCPTDSVYRLTFTLFEYAGDSQALLPRSILNSIEFPICSQYREPGEDESLLQSLGWTA